MILTTLRCELAGEQWGVTDGSQRIFDFGSDRVGAEQTVSLMRYYAIDSVCYIGKPGASFTYMLSGGGAPVGSFPGEDCIQFDPARVRVERVGTSWKIVEDLGRSQHWMFDFGDCEDEARQALDIIVEYGFTHSCFVSRPKPTS